MTAIMPAAEDESGHRLGILQCQAMAWIDAQPLRRQRNGSGAGLPAGIVALRDDRMEALARP